jgi:GT2 family glycosyltransferase
MCIPRELYVELGGMDTEYAVQYQDVDLCMRIRAAGLSLLYVPRPRLLHRESASRGDRYDMVDRALLLDSWWDEIRDGDRYYNRALSVERADYSLEGKR